MFSEENIVLSNIMAGGIAGIINMSIIHSPKTIIKYQYVNNTTISETLNKLLFKSQDKFRLFRGLIPSIAKSTLGRMGDIGIYTYYMNDTKNTNNISYSTNNNENNNISNIGSNNNNLLKIAGFTSLWRLNLIPLDTISNTYQVHGRNAVDIMKNKIKKNDFRVLYNGAMALSTINFISNYIWFGIYTELNSSLPINIFKNLPKETNNDIRNGIMGFSSSLGCDLVINPIRILKTYKQSNENNITYYESLREIMGNSNNRIGEYLFRGMRVRILLNSVSSGLFVILWKKIESKI
jgi:hypothetical protein